MWKNINSNYNFGLLILCISIINFNYSYRNITAMYVMNGMFWFQWWHFSWLVKLSVLETIHSYYRQTTYHASSRTRQCNCNVCLNSHRSLLFCAEDRGVVNATLDDTALQGVVSVIPDDVTGVDSDMKHNYQHCPRIKLQYEQMSKDNLMNEYCTTGNSAVQ